MSGDFGGVAAGDQPGTIVAAEAAIGQHAIALPREITGQAGSRRRRIADPDALGFPLQLLDELVIDRGLYQWREAQTQSGLHR